MAIQQGSFDFPTAFRSLSALLANPDDTKQAFRIVVALSGRTGERMFERFRRTQVGRVTLEERRSLLARLKDTAALEALPANSLGRAYLHFLRSQQITADGLVAASEDRAGSVPDLDDEEQLFSERLRDMHDLWHVVAGYRGDLIGEASVLALSFAQTKNPGLALMAFMAFVRIGVVPGARKMIVGGLRRGMRATWLPGVAWESLLARPLDEVRRELGLEDAPSYEPLYSADARAAGVLA